MLQRNLLMLKLKLLDRNLEGYEKLIFSYSDYLTFLPNPQLLHLILSFDLQNLIFRFKAKKNFSIS